LSKKVFEELHLRKCHEYFDVLNIIGELELRCSHLSEAALCFGNSSVYFAELSTNSVFFVRSISGQAQVLFRQKNLDGAVGLLKQAIHICESNGIQCRTYVIAKERLQQIYNEIRSSEEEEKKFFEENAELERRRAAKVTMNEVREQEASRIRDGRRLVLEALKSEDASTTPCTSLPIEYLSAASNSWTNKIGSGGFGEVFKGHDTVGNFTFAIKTISPEQLEDDEKKKFKEEMMVSLSRSACLSLIVSP
jgi:hypothetical protein